MSFEMDRDIIIEKASFLLNYGYDLDQITDTNIRYTNEHNRISISYNKFDDLSSISVFFFNENELFNVGWIAFIQSDLILNLKQKLDNVEQLLKYMEENYNNIVDVNYCTESRHKVEEYIKNQMPTL